MNPAEAALVRRVFEQFVKLGSQARLAKELNDQGYRTKLWTNRKGERGGGSHLTKAQIYWVFSDHEHVSEVELWRQVYPGEHEAIVSRAVIVLATINSVPTEVGAPSFGRGRRRRRCSRASSTAGAAGGVWGRR